MTTTEPTQRPATDGEVCDCGQPARTVYVTERFGDVPYCGAAHAGEDQTDDRTNVATTDIEALRTEAGAAGDLEMVQVCDAALDGDENARTECEAVILSARTTD